MGSSVTWRTFSYGWLIAWLHPHHLLLVGISHNMIRWSFWKKKCFLSWYDFVVKPHNIHLNTGQIINLYCMMYISKLVVNGSKPTRRLWLTCAKIMMDEPKITCWIFKFLYANSQFNWDLQYIALLIFIVLWFTFIIEKIHEVKVNKFHGRARG